MECAGEVKIFVHFLAIPPQKLQCEITTFWFEKPEAMTANFWYFRFGSATGYRNLSISVVMPAKVMTLCKEQFHCSFCMD